MCCCVLHHNLTANKHALTCLRFMTWTVIKESHSCHTYILLTLFSQFHGLILINVCVRIRLGSASFIWLQHALSVRHSWWGQRGSCLNYLRLTKACLWKYMREMIFTLHCALTKLFTFILVCSHRISKCSVGCRVQCVGLLFLNGLVLLKLSLTVVLLFSFFHCFRYESNIKLCGLYAVIFLSSNFLL